MFQFVVKYNFYFYVAETFQMQKTLPENGVPVFFSEVYYYYYFLWQWLYLFQKTKADVFMMLIPPNIHRNLTPLKNGLYNYNKYHYTWIILF